MKKRDNSTRTKTPAAGGKHRGMLILSGLLLLMITLAVVASWSSRRKSEIASAPMPLPSPPSMPANVPAREYVFAGGSLISTIEPYRPPSSDIAVWRPSNGTWYIIDSHNNASINQWGVDGDAPIAGDFDGDGRTDFSVYRPTTGYWYIYHTSDGSYEVVPWGIGGSNDIPAIGDFDGDGRSDLSIYRPSNGNWYILRSSNGQLDVIYWGDSTDIPIAKDFDGDGKSDITVWRPSTHTFFVLASNSQAYAFSNNFASGDEPVIADYDGDGKADLAVRRPNQSGTMDWIIRKSSTGTFLDPIPWGVSTDKAVPARYNESADSDAKADIAVWRPSNGTWYILKSSDGNMVSAVWGANGDIPVPSNWNK